MVRLNDILTKRDDIRRIAGRHGAHRLSVFGSVARDQASSASDIDFVVDLDPDRSLLDRIALKLALEDLLGHPVDVLNRKSLDPLVRDQILSDHVDL